jgi:aldehyde dehydrogenase (NAD+)
MEQAAAHLTPVTLELGGKSPCIVDATAEVEVTARRILWGKFFNAGQTCIAPDYLLVHREIKQALYDAFRSVLRQFFTDNPAASPDFARVMNKNHFTRLSRYIQDGRLIAGGQTDEAGLYIAPTIIEVTSLDTAVMQEEIFGPILPVLEYTSLDEVVQMVGNNPDPLAFYVFSRDKQTVQMLLNSVPFGGGCVNDTLSHIQNHALPFGGRGSSGMGSYHGIFSFNAFSHRKSVVHKGFRFDFAMKYPPYRNSHAFLRKFFLK